MMREQKKPKICFVTNELYPQAPGGIGRMLYNFARHNEQLGAPAELHYLVPAELIRNPDDRVLLDDALGEHATLHVAPALASIPHAFARSLERAAQQPWTLEHALATSYVYYVGLLEAERASGGAFDVIEFPDLGGWGLASVEAKRAGMAFTATSISARLHSSVGMIIRNERYEHAAIWNGIVVDAERHLLTHADVVVGHIGSIIKANAEHYSLTERWTRKTVQEFPPIMLEQHEEKPRAYPVASGEETDFIFSSRLQPFKRPDIFIRAAIAFLEKYPHHRGIFRIVSYGWDREYIGWLQSLVPGAFRGRIEFNLEASPELRAELLARSVVVVPSIYESLCLFAFEASKMGRTVILNKTCAAFGANPRWVDGQNCLMFDGSVDDLVGQMQRAIQWQPAAAVEATPDTPYWLNPSSLAQGTEPSSHAQRASVSVVCIGSGAAPEVELQIAAAVFLEQSLDLASGRDELVFLLPRGHFGSDGPEAERIRARGWRLEFASGVDECPEMLRKRLLRFTQDCVLILPPGFDLHPEYLGHGLRAMARDPDLAIFGGHLEVVDPSAGTPDGLRAFGGEMPSLALVSGRIAPPVSIIRRSMLERVEFDPLARDFWFEAFVRRAALNGENILIAPVIAATLDGAKSLDPETSARLNAGVLDGYGLSNSLRARLIGLEVNRVAAEVEARIHTLPNHHLINGRRVFPEYNPRDFDLVRFFPEKGGLLVHPLEDNPATVAEVAGPSERLLRLDVTVANVAQENAGIQAAVARVPQECSVPDLLRMLDNPASLPLGFACTSWVNLAPLEEANIDLYLDSASTGNDRFLLMARLANGTSEYCAHLMFKEIRYWPSRNSL